MDTINLNKMIDVYANYPTDGGVFSPMANAPWAETMTGLDLDIAYLDGHSGERFCSNIINRRLDDSDVLSTDNRTLISNILWAMFGIQWTRLWATMKPAEYDPLTNYQMQETMEGTDTTDHTKTDTYNRSYTETGTDTTAGTSSRKLTRTGNIGTNTFQNLLQQERSIWMYDFFEQVFKDVDSVLTIPIY